MRVSRAAVPVLAILPSSASVPSLHAGPVDAAGDAVGAVGAVGETLSHWKARLFGGRYRAPAPIDAPATGPVAVDLLHPVHFLIGDNAPEKDFPKGESRYRVLELPVALDHVAVRIQVLARKNPEGQGHVVYKPILYGLDEAGGITSTHEASPLHIDIRPFRRTRLLACVPMDGVRRVAIATTPDAIGKSYDTEVREAVKAPTKGGYYCSTGPVKAGMPYSATGELVVEFTAASKHGGGC